MYTTIKSPTTTSRLMDNPDFRSRLSSWSNKQHQDQSKAGTILWLQENYEMGCRESIAKEDVYHHYVAHCQAEGSEPQRASMFGKLVHRAFPGLKSSRIGTRGATRHSYKSFRPRGPSAMPSQAAAQGGGAGTREPQRPPVSLVQIKHRPDEGMHSNPSSPMSSSYSPRLHGHEEPIRGQAFRQYASDNHNHSNGNAPHILEAGDSSPTSFSSPTLPFDTFSYTSSAFSSYLPPLSSASSASKPQGDCECEECNQLAESGAVPPPGPTYFYGPSSGSYYNSYWATQNGNMMRRQLPAQLADFLFRDL